MVTQAKYTHPRSSLYAFTLIEMLVVIAIIGVLAAMLMPALMTAVGTARGLHCANNLRQQGLLVSMYADEYNSCLPPYKGGDSSFDFVTIAYGGSYSNYLTFMTVMEAYQEGEKDIGHWTGGAYSETFLCPNDQNPANKINNGGRNIGYGVNNYAFMFVSGANVSEKRVRRLSLIKHLGQTAYIGDCQNANSNHFCVNNISGNISSTAYTTDEWGQNIIAINTNQGLSLRHNNVGYNAAFFDGHVESLQYPMVPVSFAFPWCKKNN